jgi:hypothetical protein
MRKFQLNPLGKKNITICVQILSTIEKRSFPMNYLAVIIAGIAGTLVMTIVMRMAPAMGMPKMDIVGMLSTMFGKPNQMMGYVMHFMMGIIFSLIYFFLGLGSGTVVTALLYGAVHWLVVGVAMVMIPMMHAGIKSGNVQAPGIYMTNTGGMMSFVGGLIGHLVFAVVVYYTYLLF